MVYAATMAPLPRTCADDPSKTKGRQKANIMCTRITHRLSHKNRQTFVRKKSQKHYVIKNTTYIFLFKTDTLNILHNIVVLTLMLIRSMLLE